VAPDGVYDAAVAWASRFVDVPRAALAAAKAGIDDLDTLGPVARRDAERRRYLEVFDADLRPSTIEPT
jgi:enoyl-CoA hydratase